MALLYLLTALSAILPIISCQAYDAVNLTGNATSPSLQPSFTYEELFQLQNTFWENFVSPANEKQAKAINSTLLAEDILGRIDITRNFKGRELNTEYIFGLFSNLAADPNSISLLGVPLSYEITHFAANQNIASASTRVIFNTSGFFFPIPITIDTWMTFNSAKEISQYDATFKWWPWAVEYILAKAATTLGTKTEEETVQKFADSITGSICSTAEKFCKGSNAQYASTDECTTFLKNVRFGQPYEAGLNTLLCRMIHQNMVPFRPEVHCSHIGKTGGGFCVDDQDYITTVTENYFVNAPFVPSGGQ